MTKHVETLSLEKPRRTATLSSGQRSLRSPGASGLTAAWQALAAAFSHPALWVTLALILNITEGAVRKWVPGFSEGTGRSVAYFAKDVCFALGAILVIAKSSSGNRALATAALWAIPAVIAIMVGSLMSIAVDFNPVGALLSVRAILVLPILGYWYASRLKSFPLLGFALVGVALTVINAPLSLIQNGLPSSHILNRYAADTLYIVEVEHGVRATGTFAYITGLGVMSSFGVWAGMVVLSLSRNWITQFIGVIGILAGFGCAFSSISRGTVVIAIAMLVLWALSSVKATRMLGRGLWLAGLVGVVFLLLFPGMSERFIYVGEGSFDRFESAGDDNMGRAFGQFDEMWQAIQNHPLGTGLGTEQVGGSYVSKGEAALGRYETQFPRIVLEMGFIGFVGFLLLVVAVTYALQKAKGGPKQWRWNLVVTATQIYLLGQFYSNLVFNHSGSSAIWLVATAVLAAVPAAKVARRRQRRVRRTPVIEMAPEPQVQEA